MPTSETQSIEPGAQSETAVLEQPATPPSRRLRWNRYDTLIVVLLLVLAGLLRFPNLGHPSEIVFDETYYAKDACLYAGLGQRECKTDGPTEQSWVHPPLGKWLIAFGIKAAGNNPAGWRVSSAIAGMLLVAIVYLMGRTLFVSRWVGGLAGLLVATDFLLIVQSRISMLDIFLAFFVTLGFLFLALDRRNIFEIIDHARGPDAEAPGSAPPRRRWWRLAMGVAFGAALAVKWSAALAMGAAALLGLAWSLTLLAALRRTKPAPTGRAAVLEALSLVWAFLLVPAAAYLSSYAVWFANHTNDVKEFLTLHKQILDYHLTLKAKHPYQSEAWKWPFMIRPVAYYYKSKVTASHILGLGNPATWWATVPTAIWLTVRSFRSRRPERVLGMAWMFQYLPWLIISRPLFLFYMTPVVPFMMTALAAALVAAGSTGRANRVIVGIYLFIAVVALLWFFYPVLTAMPLPMKQWQMRMWMPSWI